MRLWPVVGLALAVLLSCRGVAQQAGPGAVTSVALGDAACGQCHQQIFQKYLGTPMANASGGALDHAIPGSFYHAPSKITYRFFADDSRSGSAMGAWGARHGRSSNTSWARAISA